MFLTSVQSIVRVDVLLLQDVSTVVQGLFQGHLSHVTTCHTCKRPSEGSKREVEFYELSLQVQQMPSLHDSLVRHTTGVSCCLSLLQPFLSHLNKHLPRNNADRSWCTYIDQPADWSCWGLVCCGVLCLQVAALAPDELVGDNQYFCDFCAAKSDADRRMRLRNLPPYLCLALQRFTYDYQVRAHHARAAGTLAQYTCALARAA